MSNELIMQIDERVSRTKFTTVQAGRGVAAIAVLLFHTSVVMGLSKYGEQTPFGGWTKSGDLGVDFFFVLSGFIIFSAHKHDIGHSKMLAKYAYRRATRIYPVYWFYLTALFVLIGIGVGGHHFDFTSTDIVTSYSLIHFSPTGTSLATAWTLFYEVLFYAVFSLLIINRRLGIAVFVVWFTAILVHWGNENTSSFQGVAVSLFNLNFLFGICVFAAIELIPRKAILSILLMGLVGIVAVIGLDHAGYRNIFPSFRVLAGVASAIVLLGLVSGEQAKMFTTPKWLQFLGDASYTIYLTHFALLTAFAKIIVALGIMRVLDARFSFLLLAASSCAVTCLLYLAVERPLAILMRPDAKSAR